MTMTNEEKIEKMWSALNHVVDYIYELNGEDPLRTISELNDIGFGWGWLNAFRFEDEDIDYILSES